MVTVNADRVPKPPKAENKVEGVTVVHCVLSPPLLSLDSSSPLLPPPPRAQNPHWMFLDAGTPAFLEWAPAISQRYSTRLFAQRYSARYLRCVEVLHQGAVTAVSELYSSTLVHRLNLTFTDMLGVHSGVPLQSYTRLDAEQWRAKRERVEGGEERGRFYHALKF